MKKLIASILSVFIVVSAFANTIRPDTGSPKVHLMVGTGKSEDKIYVKNLAYLQNEVLIPANSDIFKGYELVSFEIMIVPKGEQFIKEKVQGNKVNPFVFHCLKNLKTGSEIIISEIKATNSKSEIRNLQHIIYDVVDEEKSLASPETESPKVHLEVGIASGYIHTDNLQYLQEDVLMPDMLKANYELASFTLVVVPKTGDMHVFNLKGNKLSPEALVKLKGLHEGDRLIMDQVVAVKNDEKRNLAPAIYIIYNDETRFNLWLDNSQASGLHQKLLAQLDEIVKVSNNDVYDISSFKLQIINGFSDSQATDYTIEGSKLPAEALKEIKALPISSTLTFSEIKLVNKKTGETKTITSTNYRIIE